MINLTNPFAANDILWLFGTVNGDAKTSNVWIYEGFNNSLDSQQIAFHIEFNFETGWMSVNSIRNGTWAITYVLASPFQPNTRFALQLRQTSYSIEIYASQTLLMNYLFERTSPVMRNIRTSGDWQQDQTTMICASNKGQIVSTDGYQIGYSVGDRVPDLDCNIIKANFNNKMVRMTQPLDVGISVWIWGTNAASNPTNSEIFVYRGSDNSLDSQDIAMHLEFNFNTMVVTMNSMVNGVWTGISSRRCPFLKTLPFVAVLKRTASALEFYSSDIFWMSMPMDSSVVLGNLRTKGLWTQNTITQKCPAVPITTTMSTMATTTQSPTTTTKEKTQNVGKTGTSDLAIDDTGYINANTSASSTSCNCATSSTDSSRDIISKIISILKALPDIKIINNIHGNGAGTRGDKVTFGDKNVSSTTRQILNSLPKITVINNYYGNDEEGCNEEGSFEEDQCD